MCSGKNEPTADAFARNWRESDLPFFRRLWAVVRNTGRKVVRLQPCCGHPGEPGC